MGLFSSRLVGSFCESFIASERLPSSYQTIIDNYFLFLAGRLSRLVQSSSKLPVIGINGAQGTGKSTCAACLKGLLQIQGIEALVLSIDDLYLPLTDRGKIAQKVHPLLQTRGVPGTHDIALVDLVFQTARGIAKPPLSEIPRFDKGKDDRAEKGTPFPKKVDVILFEGWCVGAVPQKNINIACNELELEHDADGSWRNFVNHKLATSYARLFQQIDYLIMLKPDNFEQVYMWRGKQEEKLRADIEAQGGVQSSTMSDAELTHFIAHYERLTRWMFEEMPTRADEVFLLDKDHNIKNHIRRDDQPNKIMVSTDLDASLLNENYGWEEAKEALLALAEEEAQLVLNSSKTIDEMFPLAEELQRECGLISAPIIAENGGVIAIPDSQGEGGYRIECLGLNRQEIISIAHKIRADKKYGFIGFTDLTDNELSDLTGLSRADAAKARNRQATEPILWRDTDERFEDFVSMLVDAEIQAIRGGQFVHLMGKVSKANGLYAALSYCRSCQPEVEWQVVGIGDSPNDLEMLNAADIAVVIKNPRNQDQLEPTALQCLYPNNHSSLAWNSAVLDILNLK